MHDSLIVQPQPSVPPYVPSCFVIMQVVFLHSVQPAGVMPSLPGVSPLPPLGVAVPVMLPNLFFLAFFLGTTTGLVP